MLLSWPQHSVQFSPVDASSLLEYVSSKGRIESHQMQSTDEKQMTVRLPGENRCACTSTALSILEPQVGQRVY